MNSKNAGYTGEILKEIVKIVGCKNISKICTNLKISKKELMRKINLETELKEIETFEKCIQFLKEIDGRKRTVRKKAFEKLFTLAKTSSEFIEFYERASDKDDKIKALREAETRAKTTEEFMKVYGIALLKHYEIKTEVLENAVNSAVTFNDFLGIYKSYPIEDKSGPGKIYFLKKFLKSAKTFDDLVCLYNNTSSIDPVRLKVLKKALKFAEGFDEFWFIFCNSTDKDTKQKAFIKAKEKLMRTDQCKKFFLVVKNDPAEIDNNIRKIAEVIKGYFDYYNNF